MRLRRALGQKKASKLLSLKSEISLVIIFLDQHCSRREGALAEKGEVKFSEVYFVWLIRRKSSKLKLF